MRRIILIGLTLVLLCLLTLPSFGFSATMADPPSVSGAGVYLRRPGGRPVQIDYEPGGRLLMGAAPGSYLYFVIDNAAIAGHVAGYSAYLRLKSGEEAIEGTPQIRYLELFSQEGESHGYFYTVQIAIAEGSYDIPPIIEGTVRVATRQSERAEEFYFIAAVQEGPADRQVADIWCDPDAGAITFSHDDIYTNLIFDEFAQFFVRTGRQGPLNLDYSTGYHHYLALRYPEGAFSSLGFSSLPLFDNIGRLRLYLPAGTYIYISTAEGLISPSYTYNEAEGCFELQTRRLQIYIFSTIPLPESHTVPAKQNPPTGAAL